MARPTAPCPVIIITSSECQYSAALATEPTPPLTDSLGITRPKSWLMAADFLGHVGTHDLLGGFGLLRGFGFFLDRGGNHLDGLASVDLLAGLSDDTVDLRLQFRRQGYEPHLDARRQRTRHAPGEYPVELGVGEHELADRRVEQAQLVKVRDAAVDLPARKVSARGEPGARLDADHNGAVEADCVELPRCPTRECEDVWPEWLGELLHECGPNYRLDLVAEDRCVRHRAMVAEPDRCRQRPL